MSTLSSHFSGLSCTLVNILEFGKSQNFQVERKHLTSESSVLPSLMKRIGSSNTNCLQETPKVFRQVSIRQWPKVEDFVSSFAQ